MASYSSKLAHLNTWRETPADVRFGSKADMRFRCSDCRFTSTADIEATRTDVRFVPIADIAATYSITSSARASRDGGSVRPSALAALRLMMRLNFAGC